MAEPVSSVHRVRIRIQGMFSQAIDCGTRAATCLSRSLPKRERNERSYRKLCPQSATGTGLHFADQDMVGKVSKAFQGWWRSHDSVMC